MLNNRTTNWLFMCNNYIENSGSNKSLQKKLIHQIYKKIV